jgi:ABC-type branched-subunit amino acid transport system ATPase component
VSDGGLEVRGLAASYGGPNVVRAVSLEVAPGEAVALLGRNGAGKTSTLLAIAGALVPAAGSVRVDGREVAGRATYEVVRAGLALVPQGRRIFPNPTVQENLLLGARDRDLAPVHDLFPVLKTGAGRRGSALSGGEQQMLAIGRALMTRPTVLLMDEPSEGLAPQVVKGIGNLVRRLRDQQRLAVLIAEQNLGLALEVADRVCIMERGEIVHRAPASEFATDAASHRRYLGV